MVKLGKVVIGFSISFDGKHERGTWGRSCLVWLFAPESADRWVFALWAAD